MAFIITLYKNSAEPERIDKTAYLATALRLEGTLKEETDISTPSILFEYAGDLPAFNYVHIPAFRRYYFLTRLVSVSTKLWRMDLSCDVLQSFQNEIKKNSATLARSENHYTQLIKDSMLPFYSDRVIDKINVTSISPIAPDINNLNPYYYLLITANGGQSEPYGAVPLGKPSPLNGTNGYYIMQEFQLKAIMSLIWQESAQLGDQFLFNNLGEAVVGVRVFPFDLKNEGTSENVIKADTMKIGNISLNTSELAVYYLKRGYTVNKNVASFTVGSRGNFRDFAPYTEYSLYLPFIGIVAIDPIQYAGKPTTINYKVDLDSGKTLVSLVQSTGIVATYSGMMGASIPISNNGADQRYRESYRTVMGAISGGMSISGSEVGMSVVADTFTPIGLVGSLASAGVNIVLNQDRTVRAGGTSSPFIDMEQPLVPFIIRSRASSAEPANYASLYGRPSMKTMELKGVSGFAMIDRVHLEHLDEATEGEINEIDRLLHSGVIF